MIVHSWMWGIFLFIISQYLPHCRLTGKKKKMGVPFFLSVLLLLLCQHGFGFRFRSTAVLGYGRGYRYPSEGRYCAYSRGRHCRDAVPYQRNEFNCSADEGLPCEEGE